MPTLSSFEYLLMHELPRYYPSVLYHARAQHCVGARPAQALAAVALRVQVSGNVKNWESSFFSHFSTRLQFGVFELCIFVGKLIVKVTYT